MPDFFTSFHFGFLPAREEVVRRIEDAGLGRVRNIKLFKFSSCTPAFQVDLERTDGRAERVVLRGEQQNDILVMNSDERNIEKEIWMLNRVRSLGLNAPEVLLDGQIFSTPGYDSSGEFNQDFRFFLMEFTGGKAMDRQVKEAGEAERLRLFDRIAEIYARVHSVEGNQYGVADGKGNAVFGETDLETFLARRTERLCDIIAGLGKASFADEIRRFAAREAGALCQDLRDSGYNPAPRLCLIDGFCGNMLMEGDRINLIDMAMGGFFEPITEFCAFVYPLQELLLELAGEQTYWEHFLDAYRKHGGQLPALPLIARLLRFMFVHVLIQQLIYWMESPSTQQQEKARMLAAQMSGLLRPGIDQLEDLVSAIRRSA
jgi:hypothetical protein